MLNPFPTMWMSMLAFFILRIVIGFTLLRLGLSHIKNRQTLKEVFTNSKIIFPQFSVWLLVIVELGLSVFITLGYHTQYACLILMAFCLKMMIKTPRINTNLFPSRYYYLLLLGCSVSLFITGAGAFAFDLPL